MNRTGKSCAAVALLVTRARLGLGTPARSCVWAVCELYGASSGLRALASSAVSKQ